MNIFNMDFFGTFTNWVTAFISSILLLFNVTTVSSTAPKIDLNDYQLVFSDEFDGTKLNRDIWCSHNKEGLRKGGYWVGNQATVKDGNLIIRTEYKDGKFGVGWYTAGICTKQAFNHKYGYYECRCKLPEGEGLWSAFWLQNYDAAHKVTMTGRTGQEIDVFESPYYYLGGEKSWKVTSNIHYSGYDLFTKYHNVGITQLDNNPYRNFNTYGLKWTEDEYVFYVNGFEVARSSYGGVSRAEEFLILSCEVDGAAAKPTFGWSGDMRNNDESSFTADFVVDYVRVYDLKQN
ncbi:MAG TPA: hypothetical protein DDY98_06060 [Ruminococcaceae bacterium]|nr:hypothetical protein [Oscillospiraceae bacterium]